MTRPEPKLTAAAWTDVADAAVYYEEQRPGLAAEFLDELERITAAIREAPLLSTVVDAPIRRALLRRFPFGLFYVPGTSTEPDIVVAVVNLRQDPEIVRKAYKR